MFDRYAVRGKAGTTLHVVTAKDNDGNLIPLCGQTEEGKLYWTEHIPEDGSKLHNRCSQILSMQEENTERELNTVLRSRDAKPRPVTVLWPKA